MCSQSAKPPIEGEEKIISQQILYFVVVHYGNFNALAALRRFPPQGEPSPCLPLRGGAAGGGGEVWSLPIGKPAPDVYLKTAAGLHKKPEECLVFEDVPMGILAGKNAGMKVCAVEDAFSAQQADKKKDLADYYIDDYFQVMNHTYEVLL